MKKRDEKTRRLTLVETYFAKAQSGRRINVAEIPHHRDCGGAGFAISYGLAGLAGLSF